ncbi:MAG: phosphatidylglycerophosphatase A [bacterium]|nr:phosphatidylglycerophosphatase A [candidate division WOR-3 bacterium]MDH5682941.1 phosphatidylglycerophosphatase A [candidate division WOR-3 bacterium]
MVSVIEIVVGSVLGTGYIPLAPATFASLLTIPLILLLNPLPIAYFLSTVGFFFIGVYLANDLEKIWGKDARKITIDELVGMLITFCLIPLPNATGPRLVVILVGFLLFRFFDIVKLPLIKKSQELPKGFGVMIDDLLAGILANLCLRFLIIIFI